MVARNTINIPFDAFIRGKRISNNVFSTLVNCAQHIIPSIYANIFIEVLVPPEKREYCLMKLIMVQKKQMI